MNGLKVAIVGANGRIGRLLVSQLKQHKQFATPLALVRSEEQVQHFEQEVQVLASLTSIEDTSARKLAETIKGYDAVVFCAGAGGSSVERIFTVDLDGCAKSVEACELAGVDRFVVVSAIKADDREFWVKTGSLKNYYIAKRAADWFTRSSKLKYTILQPGMLTDDKGTAMLTPIDRLEEKADSFYQISRDDVASSIVACLLHPAQTSRKTIPLANGDTAIEKVLESA